jgi:hypothetical protein
MTQDTFVLENETMQFAEVSGVDVFIPFPGFYESWLMEEMESIVEYELEEFPSRKWENYKFDFQAAAKEYLESYSFRLQEMFEFEGFPPFLSGFEFKELISPREYNFETDRLLATYLGSPNDLLLVRLATGSMQDLERDIKDQFPSRSGFISFYDDFVGEWRSKSLEEWDANELSVLLPEFGWDDLLEGLREPLHHCVEYTGGDE